MWVLSSFKDSWLKIPQNLVLYLAQYEYWVALRIPEPNLLKIPQNLVLYLAQYEYWVALRNPEPNLLKIYSKPSIILSAIWVLSRFSYVSRFTLCE